jgi:hypothetical protein
LAVHYFPVSQDINSDPEVWELTDKFGDRSLRVWLEILSIADRNNGTLPGRWELYPSILAGRCKSTRKHLATVCQWVARWLDIDSQGVARVRNYPKYHKTRAEVSPPPNPPILSEPSEPYKISPRAAPEPSANVTKVNGLDPGIKRVADRIYATDTKRFLKLIIWIKEAQKHHFADKVIAASLLRFEPYAAQVGDGWYPYLDKIINKVNKDSNMSRSVNEHEQRKADEREVAKAWNLKGLVKDA